MSGSIKNGRSNPSGRFMNTIAQQSTEQAMLIKQDEIIAKVNALAAALATATSIADVNAAAAAFVAIVPVSIIES